MALSILAATSGVLDRPTVEQWTGMVRKGLSVTAVGAPGECLQDHVTASGVSFHGVTTRGRLDWSAIRSLRGLLRSRRPHVVHAYDAKMLGAMLVASRGLPVATVGFRGYIGHVGQLRPSSWLGFLHPRVDRIVCVSHAVERFFRELRVLGRPIPGEKIVTIYKGHDPAWYENDPVDRASLGLPPAAFTVCYCGRDRPRKGVHLLVEAAGRLDADWPIHFLLVGKMDSNLRLRKQIEASPARDRIHLVGYRADAAAIAGSADVFALPSIDREGLSRAVMEAMAQGTPAVVSDAGGLPEQVEHGVSGLVVPQSDAAALADAIARLYRDGEGTREMGVQARRRVVERFGIDRTVRETIALYEGLVGEAAVGAASG